MHAMMNELGGVLAGHENHIRGELETEGVTIKLRAAHTNQLAIIQVPLDSTEG